MQSCLDHGLVDEFLKMLGDKIDDPYSFEELCEAIDKANETQLEALVEKDILPLFCKSLKLTEADIAHLAATGISLADDLLRIRGSCLFGLETILKQGKE